MRRKWVRACLIVALVGVILLPALSMLAQGPGVTEPFDDPALRGWEHSPGVMVVDGVLHAEPENFAFLGGEWGDMALTVRVRSSGRDGPVITYSASEAGTYHVSITWRELVLHREAPGEMTLLGSFVMPRFPIDEWYEIGVFVSRGEHVITFEGMEVVRVDDPEPLPPGGIAFEIRGAAVDFDDLSITATRGPVPARSRSGGGSVRCIGTAALFLATVGLAYVAQATTVRRWPDLKPAVRWGVGIGATVLLTLAALAAALYARHYWRYEPLPVRELTRFRVYPHFVGLSAQLFIVPTALIYLFSRTPIFRRIVGGGATTRDVLKLFGALVLLQLVSLNYESGLFIQSPDYVTLGLLVTIVAGLLGGWQVGLGVGVVAFLISGTRLSIARLNMGGFLRVVWQEGGVWRLFDWALWRVFRDCYLTNPWALSPVWAGTVAGVWAGLLGKRRFTPMAAFTLGIALNLGAGYLVAIADEATPFWIESLPSSTLTVGVAMAAVALMVRSVQMEAARREAAAAELARTRAELRALRAQINPHFLFNAINTIRYFVRTDPEAARRLLLNLSEVFQRTLRSGEFVPLRDELGYVEAYLALEKARLGERLHIVRGAWAEEWLDYQVPTLILQPIVENAVVHGIAGKPEGGTVCITITRVDGALVLQVADDGMGIPPARLAEIRSSTGSSGGGIGLRNVDLRLRTLYGEDYRLTVESGVERGTCVTIRIPIEEEG